MDAPSTAPPTEDLRDLLRLTLTPGLGPILIARLLEAFGSARGVLGASARELERVRGIGSAKSVAFVRGLKESEALVERELALASKLGVRLIARGSPEYPPLLAPLPDAPPLLYIRGALRPADLDAYPVAIVGSRDSTAYGIEQAERFAAVLAGAGLTIVSGGARGIDTAAHRGALRAGGRTIAILGCGLGECYPPENAALFERVAAAEPGGAGGALISELPLSTVPDALNFPARNRLISGVSLGVIVIEAQKGSGSLITARVAAEDHGREVMAVPGRVDSPSSWGTHELIKSGGAALVTEPGDVLAILESPARHSFAGVHADRYADPARAPEALFDPAGAEMKPLSDDRAAPGAAAVSRAPGLSVAHQRILAVLEHPLTPDELARAADMPPAQLRVHLTTLEIQKRVRRQGSRIARC
ncbi:MAG: DNA-processing protein DprA [Phycisphaerales bacterium]